MATPAPGDRPATSRSGHRTFVIVNSASGSAARLTEEALPLLSESAEVLTLAHPSDLPERMSQATARGATRIVVAGGDGTVHSAIHCLAPRFGQVELAVLPFGTGNDLARAIGVPIDDVPAAVDFALHGPARPADLVEFSSSQHPHRRWFVNMCYGGFGDRVADEMDQETKRSWGLIPYWISLIKRTFNLPEHDVRLRSDRGELSARAHGVLIANSCFLGGGVPAAPQARLDDGLMDIAVMPALSAWETLGAVVDLVRGQLHENERLLTFRTSRLELSAQPDWNMTTDGEAAPGGAVTMTSLPGALRLVARADAPAFTDSPQ